MSEIVIYDDGNVELKTVVEDETIWLSQKQLCELFARDKSVISRHINNVFKSNKLDKNSTVAKNAIDIYKGGVNEVAEIIKNKFCFKIEEFIKEI